MIRMNAHIAGYDVTLEGTASEVMKELEALKEALAEKPKKPPAKKGPGTEDDQPDLPIDDPAPVGTKAEGDAANAVSGASEESTEPEGEVTPTVHDQKYKIEDVRRAIQTASRESKQAAKKYLEDTVGKADLNQLPTEKYGELMDVVGGEA